MNTFTFTRPTVFPGGSTPALCPAFTVPAQVTLAGYQVADPFTVYSSGGTYLGTNPPWTVFWSTQTSPGVYSGTAHATHWGFQVPYGWTGTILAATATVSGVQPGTLGSTVKQIYGGNGATVDNVHVFPIS